MSSIQRFACGAVMGALSCFVVITVLAEDDPFEVGPATETKTAANSATDGAEDAAVAKTDVAAETPAEDLPPRFDFCRCAGSDTVARIEHALDGPLRSNGIDFSEVPLEEVVNHLQEEYGIPIVIKDSSLEAAGLDPSEPVTVNLHKISLRSALRLMLEKLQLTWTVRHEVVEITTHDDAELNLIACVYNVRPCVADTSPESMNALIETITTCVAADSWAKNGEGRAAVQCLKPGLLVVSQTQHAHNDIASLLIAIRKMRDDSTSTE